MGFVVVQHLDPKHDSILTELLARATPMPVHEARTSMQVEADTAYVIPPNSEMTIAEGALQVKPRPQAALAMPIDSFLRSLAEDQKAKSIGVILSGSASDGALGVKAIKAEGGITFAQDNKSAKYPSMPRSAIDTGCVDFVLPPRGIASELARIGRHPYVSTKPAAALPLPETSETLNRIFALLRSGFAVDFNGYNRTTILRRILRRMALNRAETLETYFVFLNSHPQELEALYNDLLINVTSFFRDPETFQFLKAAILPKLLEKRSSESPLRIWVPGCATGEEVYSIAILMLELLGEAGKHLPMQMFATDVSEAAVERARNGVYPENIVADVAPERLRRFFVQAAGGYQIAKSIRDMCVFARHNVLKNPPFSRMDLISCRNLLIYLGPELQKKLLPTLHYALNPNGFLFLGHSESIGEFTSLFSQVDRKFKVFSRKLTAAHLGVELPSQDYVRETPPAGSVLRRDPAAAGAVLQQESDRIILTRYSLPAVLVNADMDILQFRGRTSSYLEPMPGKASLNLLRMAREGLIPALRTAIHKANKAKTTVRKTGLRVKHDGTYRDVNIEIVPIDHANLPNRHFLVVFEEVAGIEAPSSRRAGRQGKKGESSRAEARELDRLTRELAAAKEYLQSVIEDMEATNEELTGANEELQSSNEELQSTNEELQTAKEEVQSTNEELTTVNDELLNRNQELNQVSNDLTNLLHGVNIPIVMVGNDLRIRRFTPVAEAVLNLISADVGRPITDIKSNINVRDLEALLLEVIDTLTVKEREVQDAAGRWYLLRLRPYKTLDNRVDGAVLSLSDIEGLKGSQQELHVAQDYFQSILEVTGPMLLLDQDLRVMRANGAFLQAFGLRPEETEGQLLLEIGKGEWNTEPLRRLLHGLRDGQRQTRSLNLEYNFPPLGRRTLLVSARVVSMPGTQKEGILLAIRDTVAAAAHQ